jgi:predicted deacetylase
MVSAERQLAAATTTRRDRSVRHRLLPRLPRLVHIATATALVLVTAGVALGAVPRPNRTDRSWSQPAVVPAQICRAGSILAPSRRALVLYDVSGRYASYGQQTARLAANWVSHFAEPLQKPVRDYRAGEVADYSVVVYVGTTYGEKLPSAFLRDVNSGIRPVLWLGDNAWQLTGTAFADAQGWRQGPDKPGRYREVFYRGVRLTSNASDLAGIQVGPHSTAKVLGWALAADGHRTPWAIRSGNLTFVSEVPLDSQGQQDRSFAVADLLAATFGVPTARHRVLLRLEDVGPTADPTQLTAIANMLATRRTPFSVAVYPVYVGPVDQRPRKTIRLRDVPQVANAIRYMLAKGGTLVLHGYTHQLGNKRNPTNGESAEDFEFYRTHFDEHRNLIYEGPVVGDSAVWARTRIASALSEMRSAGLPRPALWEFPHYAASPEDYRVASSMFMARFERGTYAAGPVGREDLTTLTEQTPPFVTRDVYQGLVLPETLGHVAGPNIPASGTGSIAQVLADAAVQKAAVRDGVAGVFVHPFLGVRPVRDVVDGLRRQGFVFASPCSLLGE